MSATSRTALLSPAQQARANIKCTFEQINDVQSQLGSLNWLTHTWPDILFAYKAKAPIATKATKHDTRVCQKVRYA